MRRNVWTAEELRDLLGGLAILAPENQPERRGFILAMASVAASLGLGPGTVAGGQKLTEEILKTPSNPTFNRI